MTHDNPPSEPGQPAKTWIAPHDGGTGSEVDDQRVCWRFSHVDQSSRWGFERMDPGVLGDILRKMGNCDNMTVGELRSSTSIFWEHELPGDLAPEALARLAAMRRDDMTRIQRLEFTGQQRLYGFLMGNVFHVVWWDPHDEICPTRRRR